MPTLLRIDSSPSSDASFSRELTTEFVQQWKKANPDGEIITRDLTTTDLPVITTEWLGAVFTPEGGRTPEQRKVVAISDELVEELHTADEYAIGLPIYNFFIPGNLKLWIDQIVRAGKTFSYEGGSPAGMLLQKRATFIIASGLTYDPGTPLADANFAEPYLRWMFGFLGVTDVQFIQASGTSKVRYGVDRETIVQPALGLIRARFAQAAQAPR